MIQHILRRAIQTAGIDIVRYHPHDNPLAFLTSLNIQTVIDAGANIGQFAQQVRAVLPSAHIHSFEPMQECYTTLKNTFAEDAHFSAYKYALGDQETTTVIHKNEYAPSSSLLPNTELLDNTFPHARDTSEEKIEVRTLDSVLPASALKPNILFKLDVQGYEDKVLRGGEAILAASAVVLIETSFYPLYEGQPLFQDIYTLLTARGFAYHGSVQQKRHPVTHEPLFEDSVFLRTDQAPLSK